MMAFSNPSLRSRFQGCLVGAAAGDCLGAPYEICGVPTDPFKGLSTFFKQIGTEIKDKNSLCYTDDTAMTRSVAQSLIDNKDKFNHVDLAKKFAAEYRLQPGRGYGQNVTTVLEALGDDNQKDYFLPAKSQFEGSGSYGNGGAMRVAPVGLCPESEFDEMIERARQSAQLTHSNALGYNGAILQCCAVHLALHADPATFDAASFIGRLEGVMEREEARSDVLSATKASRGEKWGEYCRRLRLMRKLLEVDADIERVGTELGNLISAHKSVPAAIHSFLRCRTPVEGIETSNALERTILYAIALDGDTDTIGSMAGAIAGAFYGIESVPKGWLATCEGAEYALQQANSLYDVKF